MQLLKDLIDSLDDLCNKLLDKELWELHKDAEVIKCSLVKHNNFLQGFIDKVKTLEDDLNEN